MFAPANLAFIFASNIVGFVFEKNLQLLACFLHRVAVLARMLFVRSRQCIAWAEYRWGGKSVEKWAEKTRLDIFNL